jgi:hypothetical protein
MYRPAAALALVATLATAAPALATTVRHLDTRALTLSSRDIVIGRVAAVESYWNPGHTRIYTRVNVEVSESLKGGAGPLQLTQMGGEIDGVRYSIPGGPLFRPGEEALLFVWRAPDGRAQVTGLAQGKFEIARDPATGERTVQRAMPGLAVRDARSLALVPGSERAPRVTLDQLTREVRAAMAEDGR